jgi:hypothetical protein
MVLPPSRVLLFPPLSLSLSHLNLTLTLATTLDEYETPIEGQY